MANCELKPINEEWPIVDSNDRYCEGNTLLLDIDYRKWQTLFLVKPFYAMMTPVVLCVWALLLNWRNYDYYYYSVMTH